jgi:hypothetical protein
VIAEFAKGSPDPAGNSHCGQQHDQSQWFSRITAGIAAIAETGVEDA